MSPSEVIEMPGLLSPVKLAAQPPLPLYVDPAPEEALLSWLLRLASRMHMPLHTLSSQSFGIDDKFGHTRWWCRPHPWVLARISERTRVSVAQLRQMTFEGFQPPYRDDEASARFAGRRYDTRAPESRGYRFAVCAQCLRDDAQPHLRTPWLIGWLAVCPLHGTILIDRCKACHAGVRVAPFATEASFSPATCARCAKSFLSKDGLEAAPSVVRMQTALLQAKRTGTTELDGLGRLTWKEIVALADVLIGMVWTDLTLAEQERIFQSYASGPGNSLEGEDDIYDSRHGSLQFLAWLTTGWPDSAGATIGRSMLTRWLTADRNRLCRHLRSPQADHWSVGPNNFGLRIQRRLRVLAGAP